MTNATDVSSTQDHVLSSEGSSGQHKSLSCSANPTLVGSMMLKRLLFPDSHLEHRLHRRGKLPHSFTVSYSCLPNVHPLMNLHCKTHHWLVLSPQRHFWKVFLPCWDSQHNERQEQFQKTKGISLGFTLLSHFYCF